MKIPQMIAAEFRRLTASPMAILALVALMCVPILYGALYLWANQDPYAKLDQVPAAIVVDDTGTTIDGTAVNYGEKVAKQLVHDGSFDWHIVTRGSASSGVDTSKYDFSITFPSDFSTALASASGDSPHKATVTLTTNDANSYLSTTIGTQTAEKIRTSVVQQVNEEAASRFLVALATIRGNLVNASDGATKLADGIQTAQTGATALADGTQQLKTGSSTLASGLKTMQQQTTDLPAQTARLADGARQVAAGDQKLAGIADQAGALSQQATAALPRARADIIAQITSGLEKQGMSSADAQAEADRIATTYLDPLGAKITSGNASVQDAVGQIDTLSNGANQVSAGAQTLADKTPALASGISSAASGASKLAAGSAQAASGATSLNDGLKTLHDGATTLRDGLKNGVTQIPKSTAALRDKQASTIANPVHLDNSKVTSAGNYGAGLAPFFVALAAWIGIYALFLIVKPVSRRAITALHSPLKITAAGWLTPGLLGAVQMVGLFAIVAGALHFSVDNPVGTYGIMALSSLTFAAMILALNVWLGSVGQFLGLVLMVLQLVTAGGTFPWQTLPGPLATLHHVFPMSYTVDAMRQLMYGGSASAAWADAGVLGIWLGVALVVAAAGVIRMTHFRTLRDLQPSLIG